MPSYMLSVMTATSRSEGSTPQPPWTGCVPTRFPRAWESDRRHEEDRVVWNGALTIAGQRVQKPTPNGRGDHRLRGARPAHLAHVETA
jgi:hypothetical protein